MRFTASVDYDAIILSFYPLPHFSGSNSYILNELRYFAQINCKTAIVYPPTGVPLREALDSNLSKNIVFFPFTPQSLLSSRLNLEFSLSNFLGSLHSVSFLKKVANSPNLRFIHAHSFYSVFSAILAGQVRKTAFHLHSVGSRDKILCNRSFASLTNVKWKIQYLLGYLMDFMLEILVYNMSRIIICVTEKEVRDACRKCLNKNKIKLLYNGIDTSHFKPSVQIRQALRKKLEIPENSLVCMYLGRMIRSQGPRIVAEAIPLVNSKISNVFFVFIGYGEEKGEITKYVNENNIRNVLILDGMPAEDMLPLADIFVSHVSSNIQGHGFTILEAMATGIPTITGQDESKTKVFGSDEIVFVSKDSPEELAETIVSLQSDISRRKHLAVRGRMRVCRDFSLQSSMSKLEQLLKTLT